MAVVFVIAFLSGLATGVWWQRGMGATAAVPEETQVEPATPSTGPNAAQTARIATLESQIERLQERLDARTADRAREGLEWPADRPPQFTADGFPRAFDAALSICKPDAILVGYDCEEPPCVAKLRVNDGWHQALMSCESFATSFGATIDLATFGIDCPDSEPERVALLAPIDAEWIGSLDEAAYQARLGQRWDAIHEAWICGMP
ncbi:MAG: hypothetical protein GY898_17035 [Proteobacteria bacterium]|nr:hypothetical protein [Pseudomonadota bacterium]